MKKTCILLITIVFSILISTPLLPALDTAYKFSSSDKNTPGTANLISMDFQDVNLKTVLKVFSQQSGLNFIASENVQNRTVTIYFDNVKVEEALNYIMNANNLVYEQEPGTSIFIVKESGKPKVETITKVYELKYAQLSTPAKKSEGSGGQDPTKASSGSEGDKTGEAEIVSILRSILSKDVGKIIADKRSNSLIITDVPSQFPIVEDLLSKLDVETPQVMIRAEILETSTALVESLGIKWSGEFGTYTGPSQTTIAPMRGRFGRNDSTGGVITPGSFSLASTTATITALLSSSDTKILARPQILAMNNETAEININSNDAIESTTTWETPTNGPERRTTTFTRADKDERPGITLTVTPTISKSDFITMVLEPKLITKTLSDLSTTEDKLFDLSFRTAKTTVMVKDGETVVIGGLIRSQHESSLKKVPFLGDIPILGAAFRYKDKDNSDRELIIFITPHIVKEKIYALDDISQHEQEQLKTAKEREQEYILELLNRKRAAFMLGNSE